MADYTPSYMGFPNYGNFNFNQQQMGYGMTSFPNNYGQMNNTMSSSPAPQPMQMNSQPIMAPSLNGKFVDSEDVVKVTEVAPGSISIFPRADLQEVYVKFWNNDGTGTKTVKYFPEKNEEITKSATVANIDINVILEKINSLESKLDSFISSQKTTPQEVVKKEVDVNAY